jgi:hypothetical protein
MVARWCAVIVSVSGVMAISGCTHACPLGLHDTLMITPVNDSERVPCCGGFAFKDIAMLPSTDGLIAVTNVLQPDQQVDVFVVPTSCSKLFAGNYPGSPALCQVLVGPVTAKQVSPRVSLSAGTYRLWLQAYSTNTATTGYQVQIDVLDYRCLPVLP